MADPAAEAREITGCVSRRPQTAAGSQCRNSRSHEAAGQQATVTPCQQYPGICHAAQQRKILFIYTVWQRARLVAVAELV